MCRHTSEQSRGGVGNGGRSVVQLDRDSQFGGDFARYQVPNKGVGSRRETSISKEERKRLKRFKLIHQQFAGSELR